LSFGGQELIIILVIVLLLFGGTKIPELLRGVGKGVGELQKGLEEGKRTLHAATVTEEPKAVSKETK
jgi:sec-independent protein translocase protein TatA